MQFSVPQFIDVKEKIFGPLTLIQFIYLAAGGGISFLLWNVLEFGLFIVLAFPIMIVAVLLAFYKFNGQPFSKFLMAIFAMYTKPRIRAWKRTIEKVQKKEEDKKKKKEIAIKSKKLPEKSSLEKLSYVLDTEGGALMHDKESEEKEKAVPPPSPSEMSSQERKERMEELISGLY